MHQWFVELLRRFNLLFSLFDEERCQSIEKDGENPFLDSQLVLCSVDFLADCPERSKSGGGDAGWDMLIVDEAHHLEWSEQAPSAAYQTVENLGPQDAGVVVANRNSTSARCRWVILRGLGC